MAREYTLRLSKPVTPTNPVDAMHRLQQLAKACREIMADGVISKNEGEALQDWINQAGWLCKLWPACAIRHRLLASIGQDRKDPELEKLLQHVADACEESHEFDSFFDDPVPEILFEGRSFVFSGIFYFGTRQACIEAIEARGGVSRKMVSGSTDYLVVGGISNPRWRTPDAGTKLEAARDYRNEYAAAEENDLARQEKVRAKGKVPKQGNLPPPGPKIIREQHWVPVLLDMKMAVQTESAAAAGFRMHLPPCFEAAILHYNFHAGDLIYDTKEAYEPWKTQACRFQTAVQVVSATQGRQGLLSYKVLCPSGARLVESEVFTTTQAGFIDLLRSGEFSRPFQLE